MKKSIVVVLDDEQLIELQRIFLDEDELGALDFLKKHLRGKTATLLDSRPKVKVNVRGRDNPDEGGGASME